MKKLLFTIALLVFSIRIFALSIYAPTLVAPLDNAVGLMPNALMDWSAVAGAVSYEVQIDTASSFSNPALLNATGSALNASNLLFGVKYHWRVRAIGVTDTSAWSSSRSFTTLTSFALVSPIDGTHHCFPNQMLKWQTSPALTGFSYFDIEMDTTLNFNSPLLKLIPVAGTLTQKNVSELHFGMKYFWRMRGRHSLDTSDWSATRTLYTMDTLITTAPVDNSLNKDPNALMQWENAGGITKFEYQTDTSTAFSISSPLFFDGFVTTYKAYADTLMFGLHYYWRVRAMHSADTSGWSLVKSYSIINCPLLSSPANGTSIYPSNTPLFKWTKIGGVLKYELQVDTAISFSHPTLYYPASTAITQQSAAIPQVDTTYWRMRAISSRDTSAWCTPWSFSLQVGVNNITLNASNISVFPNPTSGITYIKFESSDVSEISVSVINILGKTIRQEIYHVGQGSNLKEMNLEGISSGIYFMKFTKANSSFVRKLTIQ